MNKGWSRALAFMLTAFLATGATTVLESVEGLLCVVRKNVLPRFERMPVPL